MAPACRNKLQWLQRVIMLRAGFLIIFCAVAGLRFANAEVLRAGAVTLEYSAQRWKLVSLRKPDSERTSVSFKRLANSAAADFDFKIPAAPQEFFTGVSERLVNGPQAANWAEGLKADLNLRGRHMDVAMQGTLGLFAPF